jgi:hypothetical protein
MARPSRNLLSIVGGVVLVAGGGLVYAANPLRHVIAPPGWYDVAPLLVSLRPTARAHQQLEEALHVARLEDLPLYDLDVSVDSDAARFTLGEDVWFTNTTNAPLPDLVFRVYVNAAPAEGSVPQVRFLSGSCVDGPPCVVTVPTPSAVRVAPAGGIPEGGRVHLKLSFDGALAKVDSSRTNLMAQGLEGLQSILGGGDPHTAGDYGLLAVGDGITSFANFYAVLARRSGLVWETEEASHLGDLGSDRMANVRARIELPRDARIAVTGEVTRERVIDPSRREVHVAAAAIRDFAFVAGPELEQLTTDVHGVRVSSYFLRGDRAAGTKVEDFATHAFEDYERRFGAYPYASFGVAESAIVGGAGGVEFSGLVTAASMFYRTAPSPGASAAADPMQALLAQALRSGGLQMDGMLEFIVAHETAHQWWHALVGSDSRDHPFEDESLAQYSSIVYLEDRYGAARATEDGDMNVKMSYSSMRLLGTGDMPGDEPVAAFPSSVAYAGVIYGKTPYFYQAVRHAIGDEAFFGALSTYVARYRFSEAPPRALVDLFARGGNDAKVRQLERRWLDEAHGDEDLGAADLQGMLGGLLGGNLGLEGMGDIERALKALEGAGLTLPSGSGAGAAPDMNELLKMFGE